MPPTSSLQSIPFGSSSFLNPNSITAAAAAFLPCPSNAFIATEKTNNLLNIGNSQSTATLNSPTNMAAAAMAAMSAAAANWRFAQMAAAANTVVGSSTTNNNNVTAMQKHALIHNLDVAKNNEFFTANSLFNLFPANHQFNQMLASTAPQNIESIDSTNDEVSQNLIPSKKAISSSFLINNISNTQLF